MSLKFIYILYIYISYIYNSYIFQGHLVTKISPWSGGMGGSQTETVPVHRWLCHLAFSFKPNRPPEAR